MKLIKRNDDWGFPSVWEDFFNNDLFNLSAMANRGTTMPAVNISENEKDFVVEVAAPGMKKDDFNLNLERNVLTISSEKKSEEKQEEKQFTRREFSYTSFQRSFTLPESVDQDKINANYKDGVLTVTLHKKEEMIPKSRAIKIS
jgi:HSP20 family protein